MRSYEQYCGLARALDVVGDRWTLLIVRELLIAGACRYTDLQYGLPGIATNLLSDRLRQMEEHGIVTREAAPPPVATTLFRLTPRGKELKPVLAALGGWGGPLLGETGECAVFRSHWVVLPIELSLSDHCPDAPPATIELRIGDRPVTMEIGEGRVSAHPGPAPARAPDLVLAGPVPVVVGVVLGGFDLDTAIGRGLEVEGDAGVLERVQPRSRAVSAGRKARVRDRR